MTEKQKLKRMIEYIYMLKKCRISRASICDEIKLRRIKLKDGTKCIKIIIKLPKED